jgi:hypothetical protein
MDLSGMFDGGSPMSPFGTYQYKGTIDGVRVGVVVASMSPGFGSFALNQGQFNSLITVKGGGKLGVAEVVFARVDPNGTFSYVGQVDAVEFLPKLESCQLRNGRWRGPFWVVPPSLVPNYNPDDDWF